MLLPDGEHLHAELKLGERFLLRGSVADVPGFLRGVDVAVLPSHSEGMSNALLEYMAAGKPVVATAVGANPKLLADGCGVLVPPNDESALDSTLCNLLSDSAARAAGDEVVDLEDHGFVQELKRCERLSREDRIAQFTLLNVEPFRQARNVRIDRAGQEFDQEVRIVRGPLLAPGAGRERAAHEVPQVQPRKERAIGRDDLKVCHWRLRSS